MLSPTNRTFNLLVLILSNILILLSCKNEIRVKKEEILLCVSCVTFRADVTKFHSFWNDPYRWFSSRPRLSRWLGPPNRSGGDRRYRSGPSSRCDVCFLWPSGKCRSWEPGVGLTLQPLALVNSGIQKVSKSGSCKVKQTQGRSLSVDQKPDSLWRSGRGTIKDPNFPVLF